MAPPSQRGYSHCLRFAALFRVAFHQNREPTSWNKSPLKSPRHLTSKHRRTSSLRRSSSRSITSPPQTFPIPSTLLPNLQLLRIKIHYTRVATTPTALSRRRFDRFLIAESGVEESHLPRRCGTGFEEPCESWGEFFGFFWGWWHCVQIVWIMLSALDKGSRLSAIHVSSISGVFGFV
jgi:hypothetical protein